MHLHNQSHLLSLICSERYIMKLWTAALDGLLINRRDRKVHVHMQRQCAPGRGLQSFEPVVERCHLSQAPSHLTIQSDKRCTRLYSVKCIVHLESHRMTSSHHQLTDGNFLKNLVRWEHFSNSMLLQPDYYCYSCCCCFSPRPYLPFELP